MSTCKNIKKLTKEEFNKSLESSPNKIILTENILYKEFVEVKELLKDNNPTNPLEITY